MTATTLGNLVMSHELELLGLHDLEMVVPIAQRLAPQGDVLLRKLDDTSVSGTFKSVPSNGVTMVEGDHNHDLVGDGGVSFILDPSNPTSELTVAYIQVDSGSTGYLLHPEHGAQGIGEGTWELRRQREASGRIAD